MVELKNVLSYYDGISCGQEALKQIGLKFENYYASEIDKYAIKVTQKNHPDTIQIGDALQIDYSKLKDIDLIIGGSPCTYWSIAKNNRETTTDGNGYRLFMAFSEGIKHFKPKFFLYENNNSIHQNIKDEITKELGVKPILINSALVSAQVRKRLYWTNIPNVTQPLDRQIILRDILESGESFNEKSYCLTSSYNGAVIWNTLQRKQRTMVAERCGIIGKGGQGQRIYYVENKSIAITTTHGGGIYKIDLPDGDYHIRKLSPIECERLQTLPDNYTSEISNTQRYKCLGNGWTLEVIKHILSNIK